MNDNITPEILELAIEFLKKRTINVRKNKYLKVNTEVIPVFDVESVLRMVKDNEFINFLSEYHKISKNEA